MNDVLTASQQTDGNNSTMTEALEDVLGAGYDIEKLTPTTNEYDIAWDSKNDQMILMDNDRRIYPEKMKIESKEVDIFKVIDSNEALSTKYSNYLKNDYKDIIITTSTGIDVGNNANITSVKYSRSADAEGQIVILRTNSYSTEIEVDAINDTVKHYDLGGNVNIINVKGESYHEFGKVKSVKILNGRFVAEEGSELDSEVITVEGGNAKVDNSKSTIWSIPEYKWSSDYSTCTASRKDKNGIKKDETEKVNSTVEIIDATFDTEGRTTYTATFTNPAFEKQYVSLNIPKLEFIQNDVSYFQQLNTGLNVSKIKANSATEALEKATKFGLVADCFNIQTPNTYFAWNRIDCKMYMVRFVDKTNENTAIQSIMIPSGEVVNTYDTSSFIYIVTGNDFYLNKNMKGVYFNNVNEITRDKTNCLKDTLEVLEIGNNVKKLTTKIVCDSDGYVLVSGKKVYRRNGGVYYYLKLVDGEYKYISKDEKVYNVTIEDLNLYDPNNACFSKFTKLESVSLGNSVELLGYGTFINCHQIKYIYYNSNALNKVQSSQNVMPFQNAGQNVYNTNGLLVVIGNKVTTVPALFYGGSTGVSQYVTEVKFEKDSICKSIDADAFSHCIYLKNVEIAKSITSFGGVNATQPFAYCEALEKVVWYGNSITVYDGDDKTKVCSTTTELQDYFRASGTYWKNKKVEVIKIDN